MIFLLLLISIGGVVAYITFITSWTYFDEANQKLHKNLAQYTADHTLSFDQSGAIDTHSVQDIMHSMMIINPDVEVYMLDTKGNILTHVAPYKKVIKEKVDLKPIKIFLNQEKSIYIKGTDPRSENGTKVFSAAPIIQNENLLGYYYIVLASEERVGVLKSLTSNYAYKLGSKLLWIALTVSLLLGLLAFWYQTKGFSKLSSVMQKFSEGNYDARIKAEDDSNFGFLSKTFNAMASQIEEQFKKIAAINDFRKELIANVSHDLRTPLSIIQGYTETMLIKKDELSEKETSNYLKIINDSSQRLGGLVNQLFELSKLETNQIKIVKEAFSLEELTSDLVAGYQVLAAKKKIQLIHHRSEGLPMVYGDIPLVERVIQNLIDNALKFTPLGGKVEILINQKGGKIKFQIMDNGVGIKEENLSAIFDRYKSNEAGESKKKSMGLGLAIAKKIIEMHDSTIEVSSKLNNGSKFSFDLPQYS
jgi:signal transduction histidine kinase